jgi:hypothetical protein
MQHSFLIQHTTNLSDKVFQLIEDSKVLSIVHIECVEYVLVMEVLEEPKITKEKNISLSQKFHHFYSIFSPVDYSHCERVAEQLLYLLPYYKHKMLAKQKQLVDDIDQFEHKYQLVVVVSKLLLY